MTQTRRGHCLSFAGVKRLLTGGLVALVCTIGTVRAQGLDKAFDALRVYNYFEAKRLFEKNGPKYPAGALHGIATIQSRKDNPFVQLDSAVANWRRSEVAFAATAPKDLAYYTSIGLNDSLRRQLRDTLAAQVWVRAQMQDTRAAYAEFVASFGATKSGAEARTRLHAFAFAEAKEANTEAAYRAYAAAYPEAEQAAEALQRAESIFFARETQPGTPEAFLSFAQRFALHPLAPAALDSVYVQSTRPGTVAALRQFIRRYPKHPRLRQAWDRLYTLATSDGEPQRYMLFASEYPDYPNRKQVVDDLRLAYARFYPIKQDSLWGYADSSWVVAIAPEYDAVEFFSEGRAVVSRGGKYGYVDRRGRLKIGLRFDEAAPFEGGVAVVGVNDRMGLIDPDGQWLLPPRYDNIGRFAEGVAPARKRGADGRDSLVFVNRRGEIVIRAEYANAGSFSEGLAWARLPAATDRDGDAKPDTLPGADSVAYISPTGERVISARFTWGDDFAGGVARVRVGELFGLIDPAGNYVLLPEYRYIGRVSQGLVRVAQGDKFGYTNLRGEWVVPLEYAFTEALASDEGSFSQSTAVIQARVGAAVLQGLVDTVGRVVVPARYEAIRPFSQGLAPVSVARRWGYLSRAQALVTPCVYTFVGAHRAGLARVRRGTLYGYVDSLGVEVIAAQFEQADDFDRGFGTARARVTKGGKLGLVNRRGKLILACELDSLEPLSGPLVRAVRKGKVGYYDLEQQTYRWTEPYYFE